MAISILKPDFTILVDHDSECFLLLIRGTHSIKDTLTTVIGDVVPFHHNVVHEGRVSDLVLGYAHYGMVAATRWIAKLAKPCLLKVLEQNPSYKLKVIKVDHEAHGVDTSEDVEKIEALMHQKNLV